MKGPWEYTNANCSDSPVFEFFLNDEESKDKKAKKEKYLKAQIVCLTCKHVKDCADWGIHHERFGVWGGLTPEQRQKQRRLKSIPLLEPRPIAIR